MSLGKEIKPNQQLYDCKFPSCNAKIIFKIMWVKVFGNCPGDLCSIPGRVIPRTQKMVLDASFLNIQHYKVRIKGKVEQSREKSSAPPIHLGVVAIEKGGFGSPSTTVANFTYMVYMIYDSKWFIPTQYLSVGQIDLK